MFGPQKEEEEEEAEIVMCLWVDKPGMHGVGGISSQSTSKRPDVHATVVLQEVLPGVSVHLFHACMLVVA